jgi:hypothetical protein
VWIPQRNYLCNWGDITEKVKLEKNHATNQIELKLEEGLKKKVITSSKIILKMRLMVFCFLMKTEILSK